MPKSTKDETTVENSIAALATEDEPKSEKEIISQTPNNLTKREQLELEYDKRDSEENKAQSDMAIKLFIILLILLVVLIGVSVVLHCLNIPELKVLENCIVFCQGALTTILGFLFGVRIHRKKL